MSKGMICGSLGGGLGYGYRMEHAENRLLHQGERGKRGELFEWSGIEPNHSKFINEYRKYRLAGTS